MREHLVPDLERDMAFSVMVADDSQSAVSMRSGEANL